MLETTAVGFTISMPSALLSQKDAKKIQEFFSSTFQNCICLLIHIFYLMFYLW